MDNDTLLRKKILDAASKAYNQSIYTYTNFLNLPELSIYNSMLSEISFIHSETFGGNESCERQIIQFGSKDEFGYEGKYPIDLIKISPLIEKFSDDLSHRDFLGALLNLGISRELLGDIIIEGHTGYVYCINHISEFIMQNLSKVKHTNVKCELTDISLNNYAPKLETYEVLCASSRIDAVVSGITKLSRSKALELFRTQKIFINGKIAENNSYIMKPDDILVIRGNGKFIYKYESRKTQKGRVYISLQHYV